MTNYIELFFREKGISGLVKCIGCLLTLCFCSCIKQVNPSIHNAPPILVVEGMVTTEAPPYTVNLSYSGKFTNAHRVPDESFITDASMTIRDDQGDSTPLEWIGNGTYQTTDSNFVGKVGRAYTVIIHLSDGKTYISSPEKIEPVAPIDSITATYDSSFITDVRPTQLIISVNTHDPAAVQNYYRWTAFGYIPHKSWGEPCNIVSPPCFTPFNCTCFALCKQLVYNDQINVLSDQFIDGREIAQHPVFYSPLYWFGNHFTEIQQYSLTKTAWVFWQQYEIQTNRTGSILDPLPASLKGNVSNQADSTDIALGLFSASDVFTKKVIIIPYFLQDYQLRSVAVDYIKMGDCHQAFPNSLPDDADPPGWENADVIEMH